MWEQLLADMARGTEREVVAARFHETLARVVAALAERAAERAGHGHVILSGGVFQNALLSERAMTLLEERGLSVLYPRHFPASDAAISLGQACIVAGRTIGAKTGR